MFSYKMVILVFVLQDLRKNKHTGSIRKFYKKGVSGDKYFLCTYCSLKGQAK